MKSMVLGILTETSVHVGGSQGAGVVDLPVAREGGTDYPYFPGSGMKGALREHESNVDLRDALFGTQDGAGAVLVGDGRLLLLPVRSLTGTYRWATCPHLLERFSRDRMRSGSPALPTTTSPKRGHAHSHSQGSDTGGDGDESLFLEERRFVVHEKDLTELVEVLGNLIANDSAAARLGDQLVVLHNDDFAWFARYGLPIQARNVLAEGTKISMNLWYEEALPADTVMYTVLAERGDGALSDVKKMFDDPYLRVGANETVGQGWCLVKLMQEDGGANV